MGGLEFSDTEQSPEGNRGELGTIRAVGGAAVVGAEMDGFSIELITKSLVYYGALAA
jgi:hypothetical protein